MIPFPFPFPMDNPWVLLMNGILCFFSIFCIVKYFIFFKKIKGWKHTDGVIEEFRFSKGSINNEISDRVDIVYSYEVDSKKFKGRRLNFSEKIFPRYIFGKNPVACRKVKYIFDYNSKLVVYYDPLNPEDSCIDIEFDTRAVVILIVLAIFFFGFLIFSKFLEGWSSL